MTPHEPAPLSEIWREVESWPLKTRLTLASRILHSVERTLGQPEVSPERAQALRDLIGIWKTDRPPSDEDVDKILEEERQKKYG